MKKLLFAALFAALCIPAPAFADVAVKDGSGASVTMNAHTIGGKQTPDHVDVDSTGAELNDPTLHAKKVDTVIKATSTDNGASVGTTAVTLIASNTSRRGYAIQNQSSSADCYISGLATATADFHSLKIAAGTYYETPPTHVGTGAISIVCTAASTSIFAREW